MTNDSLPKIAQTQPYKIDVVEGVKYSWCSCGLSSKQPFCDGAHKAFKNADGSSVMKSVSYIANESKTVSFCGCKHSKNGMFCDGSHSSLKN